MSLLISGDDSLQDTRLLEHLFEGVIADWESNDTSQRKIICRVTETGLSTASLLSGKIFDGNLAPIEPGPFKRAAAVAILSIYIPNLLILSKRIGDTSTQRLGDEELHQWRARFAFSLIAPTLAHLKICDDEGSTLDKSWHPPTRHFQIELMAWLRSLEAPFMSDKDGLTLDVPRVARAILALGLIIEASYYLIDDSLQGKGGCSEKAVALHKDDLEFDMPYGSSSEDPPQMPSEWHGD